MTVMTEWGGGARGGSFDGLRTNGFRVRGSFDGLRPNGFRGSFDGLRTNGLGGLGRMGGGPSTGSGRTGLGLGGPSTGSRHGGLSAGRTGWGASLGMTVLTGERVRLDLGWVVDWGFAACLCSLRWIQYRPSSLRCGEAVRAGGAGNAAAGSAGLLRQPPQQGEHLHRSGVRPLWYVKERPWLSQTST